MSSRGRDADLLFDERSGGSVVDEAIESPAGKLVYLYLSVTGDATTSELKEALDMSTISLYPILRTLQDRGLIEHSADRYSVSS